MRFTMDTRNIPEPPPLPVRRATQQQPVSDPRYTLWDLNYIKQEIQEWLEKGQQAGVNLNKLIEKIAQAELQAPELYRSESNDISELALNQQVILLTLYCNQIIRKITKAAIVARGELGLKNPDLQPWHELIKGSQTFALRQLPPKLNISATESIALRCRAILDKVDEMEAKILLLARQQRRPSKL